MPSPDLALAEKDTTKSCIFAFPDRPVESLPPFYPPGLPPDLYPYNPIDDWPPSPPNDPPVPGEDPIPGSNPHPYFLAFRDFAFMLPFYWEHQDIRASYVDTTQYANWQYWDINNYPNPYTGERRFAGLGWWGSNQYAWLREDVISYPAAGGANSPRTQMETIFVAETGHTYSEAAIPIDQDDWQNHVRIETGCLLMSRFYNLSHGDPPDPATYDIYVFYYAKYIDGTVIFDTSNPLTWPIVSVGPCPMISLQAPVVGTTIGTAPYAWTQAKLNIDYPYYRLALEKTVMTPIIHIPSDTVPLGLNIGY